MKTGFLGKNKEFIEKLKTKTDNLYLFENLEKFEEFYFNETIDILFFESSSFSIDVLKKIKKIDPLIYIVGLIEDIEFLEVLDMLENGFYNIITLENCESIIDDVMKIAEKWKDNILMILKKSK